MSPEVLHAAWRVADEILAEITADTRHVVDVLPALNDGDSQADR